MLHCIPTNFSKLQFEKIKDEFQTEDEEKSIKK